jgi:hypothetical protein
MPPKKPLPMDDTYLQIWKIEQEHSRTRWTVTTFFLSISFAILGLSFDSRDNLTSLWNINMPNLQRIIGLFVYWFGYSLFAQFNRYSNFLRKRLRDMEEKSRSVSPCKLRRKVSCTPNSARRFPPPGS